MVRSYPRNNFLDILRDPLTVTMMASIALHAAIGAYLLPIITKAQPEGIKADPGTVKVVELTPNELQRIPQAPAPIPTPTPQVLPPVYKPSTPVASTAPKYSTTIPASPIRTPPKKTATNTPKGSKNQPTKAPASSSGGSIFDPEIFNTPSPKPSKPPIKKGETSKASPKPTISPSIKPDRAPKKTPPKTPASEKPKVSIEPNTDDDNGGQTSENSQPTPTKTSPPPTTSPSPSTSQPVTTQSPRSSQPSPTSGSGTNNYGVLATKVAAKLQEYYAKYPGIKHIILKPKLIPYPGNFPCSKLKQAPYIVYLPVFGKTPQNQDPTFGSTTADSEEATVFTDGESGNEELMILAKKKAIEDAVQAEINRSEVDKGKEIVYSTKVEYDPKSCKK